MMLRSVSLKIILMTYKMSKVKLSSQDIKDIAKEVVKIQIDKKVLEQNRQEYKRFVSEIEDRDTFERVFSDNTHVIEGYQSNHREDVSDKWVLKMYPVLVERVKQAASMYNDILQEIIDVPTYEQYLRFRDECNVPNTVEE